MEVSEIHSLEDLEQHAADLEADVTPEEPDVTPEEPVETPEEPVETPEDGDEYVSLDDLKKGQKHINQKIGSYVRRRIEAETKAQEAADEARALREKNAALEREQQSGVMAAAGIDPLMGMDAQGLKAEEGTLWAAKRFTEEHLNDPDGVDVDDGRGNTVHFTQEQVQARHAEVEEKLFRVLPQARSAAAERERSETATRTVYPELFDPRNELSPVLGKAREIMPSLNRLPNGRALVGDMIAGALVREALGADGAAVLPKLKALLKGAKPTGGKPVAEVKPKKGVPPSPSVTPKPKPKPKPAGAGGYSADRVKTEGTFEALEEESLKEL